MSQSVAQPGKDTEADNDILYPAHAGDATVLNRNSLAGNKSSNNF